MASRRLPAVPVVERGEASGRGGVGRLPADPQAADARIKLVARIAVIIRGLVVCITSCHVTTREAFVIAIIGDPK
jgi:hypothetical protein